MACIISARLNDSRTAEAICEIEVKKGDKVVLDIDEIQELAEVQFVLDKSNEEGEVTTRLVRLATEDDIAQNVRNMEKQPQDKKIVLQFVAKNNISLKLVAVLRSLDNKKLLVMYTAEERVDFRQLVRDLATEFKMRIEMRQISEREEAFFFGGCGVCGQPICCRRFLKQPMQTSIKMAKTQCTALNPNRINGLCGKLMCCLQYEYGQYQEILTKMPKIGLQVMTPEGEGKVEFNDCLNEQVAVRLAKEGIIKKFPLENVVVLKTKEQEGDE